jgi:hypothetical protein
MIFGKSLFESVLKRIEEEAPEEAPPEETSARIRGLSTGFVAPAMEGVSVSLHRIDGAYLENGADIDDTSAAAEPPAPPVEPEAPDPAEPPPHLLRLLPAEIAEDLGLVADDTIASLQEKRRSFARVNHPDRVHAAHRHLANERMTVANLLVDKAIARIGVIGRLGLR